MLTLLAVVLLLPVLAAVGFYAWFDEAALRLRVADAVRQATETGIDVLIVDTAGRLQNKAGLMDELSKIRRVLGRLNPASPHDVVLGGRRAATQPLDAKGEHRHRRRLALAQCEQLAQVLEQLLAIRQAGGEVGRAGGPMLLRAPPALDREAHPAPATRRGELIAADDVFGALTQPARRVLGVGLDDDDHERGQPEGRGVDDERREGAERRDEETGEGPAEQGRAAAAGTPPAHRPLERDTGERRHLVQQAVAGAGIEGEHPFPALARQEGQVADSAEVVDRPAHACLRVQRPVREGNEGRPLPPRRQVRRAEVGHGSRHDHDVGARGDPLQGRLEIERRLDRQHGHPGRREEAPRA